VQIGDGGREGGDGDQRRGCPEQGLHAAPVYRGANLPELVMAAAYLLLICSVAKGIIELKIDSRLG
jgi:hypothetical protein